MNNLNADLKGMINGDKFEETAINIPFADEEEMTPQVKHKIPDKIANSNESISSNDSDAQAKKYQRSLSARKGANLRIEIERPSSSSEDEIDPKTLEAEKRDKPGPLISDMVKSISDAPILGLRRNSFSMPALNELDLDALRSLHMAAVNDDDDDMDPMKSKESLSEINVSNLFVLLIKFTITVANVDFVLFTLSLKFFLLKILSTVIIITMIYMTAC